MSVGSILSKLFQSTADEPLGKVAAQFADDSIKQFTKSSADDIAAKHGNLIATHQIDYDKLAQAADLGGFVQPSMAVVDPSKAVNFMPDGGYGDIVMVANRNAIDPKVAASKTYIGDRDIYSPRFPRTSYNVNTDRLDEMIEGTGMSKQYALSNLDLDSESPMYDSFVRELYQHHNPSTKGLSTFDMRELGGYKPFADDTYNQLKGDRELIYYTNSGRQIRKPLTAENANDIMNKSGSVGTENGMKSPSTNLLNSTTKRLPSLDSLYKNKYRLIDTEVGEQTKEALGGELARISSEIDDMGIKLFDDSNPYTQRDRIMNWVSDIASNQKNIYPDPATVGLPQNILDDIKNLGTVYKDVPVNYFEAKPRRVVRGNEFHAAYIPDDSSPEVIEQLQRLGVENIRKYLDKGDLDLSLAKLAKEGKRGTSPYVLGLGGIVPAGGILGAMFSGNGNDQQPMA